MVGERTASLAGGVRRLAGQHERLREEDLRGNAARIEGDRTAQLGFRLRPEPLLAEDRGENQMRLARLAGRQLPRQRTPQIGHRPSVVPQVPVEHAPAPIEAARGPALFRIGVGG